MDFTILDTETASLQGGVVEIAWLRINDKLEVIDEFQSLVNPERPIDPGAFAIHGISEEDVAWSPTLAMIAEKITWPVYMIAHNVSFDARMVKPHIIPETTLCTLSLSRQYIKGTTNHKLPTLKQELKLPEQKSHSALGDVYTVLDLLRFLMPLTGRTLEQMFHAGNTPRVMLYMPFGMHKGKPILQVPKGYRDWLRAQPDLPPELAYTLNLHKDV